MEEILTNLYQMTAFSDIIASNGTYLIMYVLAFVLLYLGIVKHFEPLLLIPIAFGVLIANFPGGDMGVYQADEAGCIRDAAGNVLAENIWEMSLPQIAHDLGLMNFLYYMLIKTGFLPPVIFMGVGALTDFGPMLRNLRLSIFGAAAQLGIFAVLLVAVGSGFFNIKEAAALGIIGGADGPTAIYTTIKLAPHLLAPIAIAAYSYMALVPVIIPLVVKLTCSEKELKINMKEQDKLFPPTNKMKNEKVIKIIFPIAVTTIVALLVPSAVSLIGMLMFGNRFRHQPPVRHHQQLYHEHGYGVPRTLCRCNHDGTGFPELDHHRHRYRRFLCLRSQHCFRHYDGEDYKPVLEEEDQSAHRSHGVECRADGKSCVQRNLHEVRPQEPRSELLHVVKRERCDWFGSGSWSAHFVPPEPLALIKFYKKRRG